MEWVFLLGGAGVAAYLLLNSGFKLGRKSFGPAIAQAKLDHATDRHNLLGTWRREVANILIWSDPTRFVSFYQTLHFQLSDIGKWSPEARKEKYRELSDKYPLHENFDPFSTRGHILYAQASAYDSADELEQKYRDMSLFEALLIASNEEWRSFEATSLNDLEHMKKYVREIVDTKFRLRLERAMHDYYLARRASENASRWEIDNDLVRICSVPHFAEVRYGVHFKDTNDFGMFCCFHHDDGRTFESYVRSDREFEEEIRLEPIREILDQHRAIFDPTGAFR